MHTETASVMNFETSFQIVLPKKRDKKYDNVIICQISVESI